MSDYLAPLRLTASYNLSAMQFVCVDGVQGDWLCRPCTAPTTDLPIGVTTIAYNVGPGLPAAFGVTGYTPIAASPTQSVQIYHSGDVAPVVLGGTVTAGNLIGFNSSGAAIAVTKGSGNYYGGVALQAGLSGGVIDILTHFGVA